MRTDDLPVKDNVDGGAGVARLEW